MSSEEDQHVVDAIVAARDNVALLQEWGGGIALDELRADRKT